MTDRVEIAQTHLNRHENEGDQFINRIVAIDETWLHSYEPELKSQSSEWHTPSSPRPAKFRRTQGALKQLAIIAYDNRGILVDGLRSHRTVGYWNILCKVSASKIEASYT